MNATPEQLHELLTYCLDFAKVMLDDSGEFYPFGAVLRPDGKVGAVGGFDGHEHPNPQDIYRLLEAGFIKEIQDGSIVAVALTTNVNIPTNYEAPAPDGIRVHLESSDFSRFIYLPYRITKQGLFKRKLKTEVLESFAVQISPSFFADVRNA